MSGEKMKLFEARSHYEGERLPQAYLSVGWLRGCMSNRQQIRGIFARLMWPGRKSVTYRDSFWDAYMDGRIATSFLLWVRVPRGRRWPSLSINKGFVPHGDAKMIATEDAIRDGIADRPSTEIVC